MYNNVRLIVNNSMYSPTKRVKRCMQLNASTGGFYFKGEGGGELAILKLTTITKDTKFCN